MANHKVYYGEYSLKRWIDLLLSGNIVLPAYQRYFVWKENQVRRLLKSIKANQFLPAVTIAYCKNPGSNQMENMVLDGQQRLTSLLISYIGKFPNRKTPTIRKFADENDNVDNEVDDNKWTDWTFSEFQKLGCEKQTIVDEINNGYAAKYYDFSLDGILLNDRFLSTHYIQFAYILPDSNIGEKERSKYLTNVFHSINKEGTKLTAIESRAALYYQGRDHRSELEPTFFKDVSVNSSPIDYVRFLALLSNYKKVGKARTAVGYGNVSAREELYEEFVYAYVDDDLKDSELFEMDIDHYNENLSYLEHALDELSLKVRACRGIIELDYVYAGLVYYIMVEGKQYDISKWPEILVALTEAFDNASDDERRRPGALTFMRERLQRSIQIYSNMFIL